MDSLALSLCSSGSRAFFFFSSSSVSDSHNQRTERSASASHCTENVRRWGPSRECFCREVQQRRRSKRVELECAADSWDKSPSHSFLHLPPRARSYLWSHIQTSTCCEKQLLNRTGGFGLAHPLHWQDIQGGWMDFYKNLRVHLAPLHKRRFRPIVEKIMERGANDGSFYAICNVYHQFSIFRLRDKEPRNRYTIGPSSSPSLLSVVILSSSGGNDLLFTHSFAYRLYRTKFTTVLNGRYSSEGIFSTTTFVQSLTNWIPSSLPNATEKLIGAFMVSSNVEERCTTLQDSWDFFSALCTLNAY